MTETWKSIPEFEGYEISSLGRVRSYWTKKNSKNWHIGETVRRILKPGTNPQGYLIVCLRHNSGRRITQSVSRLVLSAFVGPAPPDMHNPDACHNDGTRDNNRLENLRWDSHRNNFYEGRGRYPYLQEATE